MLCLSISCSVGVHMFECWVEHYTVHKAATADSLRMRWFHELYSLILLAIVPLLGADIGIQESVMFRLIHVYCPTNQFQ